MWTSVAQPVELSSAAFHGLWTGSGHSVSRDHFFIHTQKETLGCQNGRMQKIPLQTSKCIDLRNYSSVSIT